MKKFENAIHRHEYRLGVGPVIATITERVLANYHRQPYSLLGMVVVVRDIFLIKDPKNRITKAFEPLYDPSNIVIFIVLD